MNKFFILLLLNIILPYTGFTQNPLLVEYDCKTGTLNKPFPFDQSFVVRLKNIPPEWGKVTIEIREVRKLRKHVKDLSRPDKICFKEKLRACTDNKPNDDKTNLDKTNIENADLFSKLTPTFKHEYERVKNFKGDTLEFLQLGYFRPNTDYVFDISPTTLRSLSREEKDNLRKHLDNLQIINNLIFELSDRLHDDSKEYKNVAELVNRMSIDFGYEISKYNPNYQFKVFTEDEFTKIGIKYLDKVALFNSNMKDFDKELEKRIKNLNVTGIDKWDFSSCLKKIILNECDNELNKCFEEWMNKQSSSLSEENQKKFKNAFKTLEESYDYKQLLVSMQDMLELTKDYVNDVVDKKTTSFFSTIGSTYFSGATENARTYLSVDAGYGANMTTRNEFPYLGVNIYLRPIKREIPLRHYHGNFCDFFSSHFSFLVGMTTNSIESDPMRGGVIGNKAILLGGGVRILPWLKLNYGRMVYYDMPANPLVNRRYLASDGFISASIDADVVEIFKTFFKLK